MACSEEGGTGGEAETSSLFYSLSQQIDSTVHAEFQRQKASFRVLNSFAKIAGEDELIPVGSCMDGSKISIPGDSGDIDVLLISKKVTLDQSWFEYDRRYPAFLRVLADGPHQKYCAGVDLVEGKYMPVSVLKAIKEDFYTVIKFFVSTKTLPKVSKDNKFLNVVRNSAVGLETIQLDPEPLTDLGLPVGEGKGDGLRVAGRFVSKGLNMVMDMMDNEEHTKKTDYASEDTNVFQTIYKFLEFMNDENTDGNEEKQQAHENPGVADIHTKEKETMPADGGSMQSDESKDGESKMVDDSVSEICETEIAGDKSVSKDFAPPSLVDERSDEEQFLEIHTREPNIEPCDLNIEHKMQAFPVANSDNVDTKSNTDFVEYKLADVLQDTTYNHCSERTEMPKTEGSSDCRPKHPEEETITSFAKLLSTDLVPAFIFNGWPRIANEWLERNRKWPSDGVKDAILQTGCQIVAKRPLFPELNGDVKKEDHSPEHDKRDPYFRLSFSQCEVVLSQSLTEPQLLCWRVMKAFQKAYLSTEPRVLASYHWKNVVFWVFEETEPAFWTPRNLLKGVCKALDRMILFLRSKFIPVYFVPTCNLIDGCREDVIEEVCERVVSIRSNPVEYLKKFLEHPPIPERYSLEHGHIKDLLSEDKHRKGNEGVIDDLLSMFRQYPQAFDDEDYGERFRSASLSISESLREAAMSDLSDQDPGGEREALLDSFTECFRNLRKEEGFDGFKKFRDVFFGMADSAANSVCDQEERERMQTFSSSLKNLMSRVDEDTHQSDDSDNDDDVMGTIVDKFGPFMNSLFPSQHRKKKQESSDKEDQTSDDKMSRGVRAFVNSLQQKFGKDGDSKENRVNKPASEHMKDIVMAVENEVNKDGRNENTSQIMDIDLD